MTGDYKLIDQSSQESTMEALDLFHVPLSKTSIMKGDVFELPPAIPPNGLSTLTFNITGNQTFYIDLNNTHLHIQCKIKNSDDTDLNADPARVKITQCNNLFHSMISNVKIFINQQEVESNANYAYKTFVTTMLNYGKEAKSTHLATTRWIDDGMHEEHTEHLTGHQKTLMAARAAKLAGGKTLDMIGRPNTPLFNQDHFLIPGLNIRLEFEFNNPHMLLQTTEDGLNDNYKIEIVKADLLLRRVQAHPSIATSHAKLLSQGKKALYPLNRTDVKFFTISPGRQSQTLNVINNQQEPKILIIGLLSHRAKEGSLDHSAFKFEHFDISSINVSMNGSFALQKPLEMNFRTGIYTRAYHNLMSVCEKSHTDAGNDISLEHFKNSLVLHAFDLTPDWCHGEGIHLMRSSDTFVELTFSHPLPETVSAMVYFEYDELLRIDKTRTVELASKS